MSVRHNKADNPPASKPADNTRTRLLDAAAEVFAERGFDKATIREICRRAGSNVALVNYHFGDKLELYTEVFRRSLQCGSKPVPALPPATTEPAVALRQIVDAMLERAFEKRDDTNLRYRLMLHEFARPSVAMARVVDVALRPVYERLCEIVGALLERPPRHRTTRLCVHGILGQVAHFSHSGRILDLLWPQMQMTAPQRKMVAQHITESTLAYLRECRVGRHRPPGRGARKNSTK